MSSGCNSLVWLNLSGCMTCSRSACSWVSTHGLRPSESSHVELFFGLLQLRAHTLPAACSCEMNDRKYRTPNCFGVPRSTGRSPCQGTQVEEEHGHIQARHVFLARIASLVAAMQHTEEQ